MNLVGVSNIKIVIGVDASTGVTSMEVINSDTDIVLGVITVESAKGENFLRSLLDSFTGIVQVLDPDEYKMYITPSESTATVGFL